MGSHLWLTAGAVALVLSAPVAAQTCSGMTPGQLTSLNGFVPFPANNAWNTDVSAMPVDPNSANLIAYIGATKPVHADFGAGLYSGQSIGIPYQIVTGAQAKVNIKLKAYASESDPGPEPIPSNALIEGYPKPGNGDRHVIVLDKDNCWLYELGTASLTNGQWSANVTTVWDMTSNEMRPYTWTSVDAAGLSVFAGLARYDEVAEGAIHHALRFTVPSTREAFTAPASHWASSVTSTNAPPMGMRLRLKATFDISGFSAQNQVILTALKKYGLILADNGSAMYISGAPDPRWNNDDLSKLKALTAANFEVVEMGPVYTPSNVPRGKAPAIASFTASASTVSAGQPVTLNWSVSNASYNLITPQVGPVRGTSLMVVPSATTTYVLDSTNAFGRSSAKVTVTVR
jgi:hypothetical protein